MKKKLTTSSFPYFCFIYLGVVCLLSWNVILCSLDAYENRFPGKNSSYYFTNMNFILNVVFQFYFVFYGNKFTYKKQIIISHILFTF